LSGRNVLALKRFGAQMLRTEATFFFFFAIGEKVAQKRKKIFV
jgi:hypothetical protein